MTNVTYNPNTMDPITPTPEGASDPQVPAAPQAGSPLVPAPEAGEPQDPVEPKAPEGQEDPQPEGEAAPDPVPSEPDDAANPRIKGAIERVEKANESLRTAITVQAKLVETNPDAIHTIAETDITMANQVIEKLWGAQYGIHTYKQLQDRVEAETLKEKNPEAYESRVRLSEVERKLEAKEQRERAQAQERFFKAKGIVNNAYDPKHQQLMSALKNVNPQLVEEDYEQALSIAHTIAFGGKVPVGAKPMPDGVNYGGGAPSKVLPDNKPQRSELSSWLIPEMNKRFKYNIPA